MVMRITVGAAALLAVIIAWMLSESDRQIAVPGTRSFVTVWRIGDDAEGGHAALRTAAAAAANRLDIAVYKEYGGDASEGWSASVYAINSAASRHFVRPASGHIDGVPVRTVDKLPDRRLTGQWDLDVDGEAAAAFAAALRTTGAEVTMLPLTAKNRIFWAIETTPVLPATICAALALIAGTARWRIAIGRHDAIERVHGARPARLELGHARSIITVGGVVGGVALATATAIAAVTVRPSFAGLIASSGTVGVGAAILLATATAVTTGVLYGHRRDRLRIAGTEPPEAMFIGGAVGVLVAAFVVVGMVSNATTISVDAIRNLQEQTAWDQESAVSLVQLRASRDEYDASEPRVAAFVRAMDRRGEVVLARHPGASWGGYRPDTGTVLTVNPAYLDRQVILDAQGERITSHSIASDRVTVLAPPASAGASSADKQSLADDELRAVWRASILEPGTTPLDAAARDRVSGPIEIRRVRPAQCIFDYGTQSGDRTSSRTGPVVAVVPDPFGVFSADTTAAYLTTADILFTDAPRLRSAMRSAGLDDLPLEVVNARELAHARMTEIERSLRNALIALIVASATVVFTTLVLLEIIASRRRLPLRVLATHGSARIRRTVTLLAPVGIAAGGGLAIAARTGDVWGPLAPMPAVVVVAFCVSLGVVAHTAMTRRSTLRRGTRPTNQPTRHERNA